MVWWVGRRASTPCPGHSSLETMTQESYRHPITPPPWRVQEWGEEAARRQYTGSETDQHIATEAAQWGADTELEACCLWVNSVDDDDCFGANLRAARRPKPPSLKEQAIAELDDAVMRGDCITVSEALPTIRRALEQLDD
jgi:hypothetical protein